MGLFDMFKSDKGDQMTPHLALATALIYMIAADGEVDNEEVGHLLAVLGGEEAGGTIGVGANNRHLLSRAQQYARTHTLDAFLDEATPLLTDAQKMIILINLLDSSLSDGQPEPEEQVLFGKFLHAFAVSEARFRPFFEVIALKHDRNVFLNPEHPKNQPGYTVTLSLEADR